MKYPKRPKGNWFNRFSCKDRSKIFVAKAKRNLVKATWRGEVLIGKLQVDKDGNKRGLYYLSGRFDQGFLVKAHSFEKTRNPKGKFHAVCILFERQNGKLLYHIQYWLFGEEHLITLQEDEQCGYFTGTQRMCENIYLKANDKLKPRILEQEWAKMEYEKIKFGPLFNQK